MLEVNSTKVVELVAASYDESLSASWRQCVLHAWHDAFRTKYASGVFEFELSDVEGGARFDRVFGWRALGDDYDVEAAVRQQLALPPAVVSVLFHNTGSGTASEQSRYGATLPELPYWRAIWKPEVQDAIGLIVRDPSGAGLCFGKGLAEITTLTARENALLAKVAVHIGAGYRLRRTPRMKPMEEADAILSPRGKLLHAVPAAQSTRDVLDDGLRRRDAAKNTRDDAEKALEIWRGLVAGQWSLVDHFDSDGKRFVLAIKNAHEVAPRRDLTERERRAAALAAMGHRDKEIAYMLGLEIGAIASALHRARVKLGVKSRSELATSWRRNATTK